MSLRGEQLPLLPGAASYPLSNGVSEEMAPKKRGRPRAKAWVSTAIACEILGISRYTLATARDGGQLKKGHHWKVKNPQAQRLTYLWHVERLEKWQSEVIIS
jgi:hypothetical protein